MNIGTNDRVKKPGAMPAGIGKLPPQAVDLEQAVLGALMLEKRALQDVADIIKPEIFYDDRHRIIYEAIQQINLTGGPVDILTVTAQLRKQGKLDIIGGAYYITELTNRVASAANIEYHTRIVVEKSIRRELINSLSEIVEKCYNDTEDIFTAMSEAELKKDNALRGLFSRKEVSNGELFEQRLAHLYKIAQNPGSLTGVPSGFTELDKITNGWQKSNLIVLAARPAMGKTSLGLQMVCNAAMKNNIPVAIFSLEMPKEELMDKEIAISTDVPLWKIKKCPDSEDFSRIVYYRKQINEAPIHWEDASDLTISQFRAQARRMKARYDIKIILIDYLQLLHAENRSGTREQEISTISRMLKATAKELDIPVIAISQLSRKVEDQTDKSNRPKLSHLRESGSIEQDADIVLFLYRPEYYKIMQTEAGNPTAGLAEVIIAKNRNGQTGDIVLKFNADTTGFSDVNELSAF